MTKSALSGMKVSITTGMDLKFINRNMPGLNKNPMAKAAALTRTIMRGSIRRVRWSKRKGAFADKPSPVGKPPYARTGIRPGGQKTPSKSIPFKRIEYDVAQSKTQAVIGHYFYQNIPKQDPRVTPMEAHEFARRVRVPRRKKEIRRKARSEKQRKAAARLYKEGRIKRKKQHQAAMGFRMVQMPPRPFAWPALQKAATRLGFYWKGIVKKSSVRSTKIRMH